MTPTDLRATLSRLGLSQVGAAKLFGINDRTFRRWVEGKWPVPNAVSLSLILIERYSVPLDDAFALVTDKADTETQL